MEAAPRITREPPGGADYRALYRAGLARVQALAEKTWTDYNEHDPGVTILELLCYALTDIAYRVDHPIEDILAPPPGVADDERSDTFYTGEKILTCDPLTVDDFRKLVYDRIGPLRNAWLAPARAADVGGLYAVRLQPWQQDLDPGSPGARYLRSAAAAVLRAHRNVGEDFETIDVLAPLKITLQAEIQVGFDDTPEDILANVLFALGDELIPFPRVTNIDSRFQQGAPPDEIFLGPRLDYGDIDDRYLEDLPASVTLERILSIVRNAEGVVNVRDLAVTVHDAGGGESVHGMVPPRPIFLPEGHVPYLDVPSSLGKLAIVRDGKRQGIDPDRVQKSFDHLVRLRLDRELYAKRRMEDIDYRRLPWGRHRDLGRYGSIQRHFPVAYGLGAYGIPDLVSRAFVGHDEDRSRREIQVKQLRAYLLFFEQLLANQLAQLANVPRLFSLERGLDQTYFWQAPSDVPGIESVIGRDAGGGESGDADERLRRFVDDLAAIVRAQDPRLDRRERLLDHLLARFNERFEDEELELLRREQARRRYSGDRDKVRIRWKRDFLREYVDLSGGRGTGIDYAVAAGYRVDVIAPADPAVPGSGGVILMGRRHVSSRAGASELERQILSLGSAPGSYRPAGEGDRLQLVTEAGEVVATTPIRPLDAQAPPPSAEALAGSIRGIDARTGRGPEAAIVIGDPTPCALERRVSLLAGCTTDVYLLEHVLLRPIGDGHAPRHPWSPERHTLSASFFFSGWQRRFQSEDYRRFAERILRENCPAHVAVSGYWLSGDDMATFKTLYYAWREAKSEACALVDRGGPDADTATGLVRVDALADALRGFVDSRRGANP